MVKTKISAVCFYKISKICMPNRLSSFCDPVKTYRQTYHTFVVFLGSWRSVFCFFFCNRNIILSVRYNRKKINWNVRKKWKRKRTFANHNLIMNGCMWVCNNSYFIGWKINLLKLYQIWWAKQVFEIWRNIVTASTAAIWRTDNK